MWSLDLVNDFLDLVNDFLDLVNDFLDLVNDFLDLVNVVALPHSSDPLTSLRALTGSFPGS
jgi:hypothetical protein